MRVKFWEMKFDGTKYKDSNGVVWKLDDIKNNFYADIAGMGIAGMGISVLTLYYTHKQLVDMEFEEVIDWSKIPIDTKVLVWNESDKQKLPRHFAGVDSGTGRVLTWYIGKTSFTTETTTDWDYAELYEEESEK